jgi:ParB-like chromosome segregation protein Spo0J
MNIIEIKLSELHCSEDNIRIHTEKQLKEFERSIKMFGQIRPLVVDEENTVLCGNGLYVALKRLGYETTSVYKVEGLSENQKKKLMIADNKIYGLGIDDLETFNKFLNDLGNDLDIPGFDEDILRSMGAEAEAVTETLSEYGTIDDEEIQAIQASRERAGSYIVNSATGQSTKAEAPTPIGNTLSDKEELSKAEERQFIICPECGCKVWL